MSVKPWTQGAFELLEHGIEHLKLGSDFDLRMAMICIDNAVELMVKNYLEFPPSEEGLDIPRKEKKELLRYFPSMIKGIERHSPAKFAGMETEEILFFHETRNKLYHEGIIITSKQSHVKKYAEIAKTLFSNFFQIDYWKWRIGKQAQALSQALEFFDNWDYLESVLLMEMDNFNAQFEGEDEMVDIDEVASLDFGGDLTKIHESFYKDFVSVRSFRDKVAQETKTPSYKDFQQYNFLLKKLVDAWDEFERFLGGK